MNEVLVKTSMANLPMVSEDKVVMDDFFNECHLGYSKDCTTPIGDLFNTYNMYRNTSGLVCYPFATTRTFSKWMYTYCQYYQTKQIYSAGKFTTCCNIVMDGMSIDEMGEYIASTNVQAPTPIEAPKLVEQAQLTTIAKVVQPANTFIASAPTAPVANKVENVANNASNFNRNTTPSMNTYGSTESAKDKASKAVVNEFVNLRLSLKKAAIAYGHLTNALQTLGIDLSQVESIAESMKQQAFASCYNYDGKGYHTDENYVPRNKQSANLPNKNKPNYRMNNRSDGDNMYQKRQQYQQYQQQQQYHPTYHAPEYTDAELSEDANAYNAQQSRINRWYNNWNA